MNLPSIRLTTKPAAFVLTLTLLALSWGCSSSRIADQEPQPASSRAIDPSRWNSMHNPDRALQFFMAGSLHESNNEWLAAQAAYENALKYDDDANIFIGMSRTTAQNGNIQHALVYAQQAILRAPEKLDYRKHIAELFVALGRIDSATSHLQYVADHDPSDTQSRFALAYLYEQTDPNRAIALYEELRGSMGNDWNLSTRLAELYSNAGRPRDAAQELETMRKMEPENALVVRTLAALYIQLREFDRALDLYALLSEREPENVVYRLGIAEAQLHLNNWEAAAQEMRYALELPDILTDDALRIGEIFFQQALSNTTRAVEAMDAILVLKKKFPNEWQPSWYLGAMMFSQGMYDQSIAHFRDALVLNPDNLQVLDVLSRANLAIGKFDDASATLERMVELDGSNSIAWTELGYALQQTGDTKHAINALKKALEVDPQSIDALSTLAMLYDDTKKFKESDRLYTAAITLYTDGTLQRDRNYLLLLNNYAYALSKRGEHLDMALQYAETAAQEESTNGSFLDTAGWVHYVRGNYQKAREYIEKAIEETTKQGIQPSSVLFDHLGDVYLKLGQPDTAVSLWEKALAQDPGNNNLERKIRQEKK